jgi:hypothetical protein
MSSRTLKPSTSTYPASMPATVWCALAEGCLDSLFVNAIRHQEGTSGAT